MTEAIIRKLNFPHFLVQSQGVNQLLSAITTKHAAGKDKHEYADELEILWQNCSSKYNVVGELCAESILDLVKHQILSPSTTIKTALNYIASSTRTEFLIQIMDSLLLVHLEMAGDKYVKNVIKYNLRSPPHPLISALQSNNECFATVCNIMFTRLCNQNEKPNKLNILNLSKPLLVFMCCDNSKFSIPYFSILDCLRNSGKNLEYKTELNKFFYNIVINKKITDSNVNFYLELLNQWNCVSEENYFYGVLLKLLGFVNVSENMSTSYKILSKIQNILSNFDNFNENWGCLIIKSLIYLLYNSSSLIIKCTLKLLDFILKQFSSVNNLLYELVLIIKSCLLNFVMLPPNSISKPSQILFTLFEIVKKITEDNDNLIKNDYIHDVNESSVKIDEWTVQLKSENIILESIFSSPITLNHWLNSESGSRNEQYKNIGIYCALILWYSNKNYSDTLNDILQSLYKYSEFFPGTSLHVIPTVLYSIKRCTIASQKLSLFYALPKLVHHHSCIPVVLNTIKMLSKAEGMFPLAIRLMMDLWKKYDRCFSHFQNLILNTNMKAIDDEDLLVIQSTAIREICKNRPHQYASEMLQLMTSILNMSNKQSLYAAISVDGIYYLCENESLDIVSTWNILLRNIYNKSQGIVTERILKVLGLIQKLSIDTPEYTQYKSEIVKLVWSRVFDPNINIVAAALEALSNFDSAEFMIRNLHENFRPEIEGKDNEEDIQKFLDSPIPGYCYIKLMLKLSEEALCEFELFLKSIILKEMAGMPRDIHHRAMRQQRLSSQPQYLQDISGYVLKMYEKNKQPNLKSSLAMALLICHNPPKEMGTDGKPVYRTYVSRGRSFFQLFQILLGEVPLDPNDWQGILWAVKGWETFMERCFTAMVDGRKAELEMQLNRGSSKEEKLTCDEIEDIQLKQHNAHLWCRDKLMHELTSGSKGSPGKQGNCALALASLAIAGIKLDKLHQESKKEEENNDSSIYVKMGHWVIKVSDTLMCIADEDFKPPGRIFSWCQYNSVSQTGRLSTTQLGKICAFYGFPLLLNALMPKHNIKAFNMLSLLFSNAFTATKYDQDLPEISTTSNITKHALIALGKFQSISVKEKYETILGPEGKVLNEQCFKNFVKAFNKNSVEFKNIDEIGVIIGLGYFSSSIVYYSDDFETKKQSIDILDLLIHSLDDEDVSQTYINAVCFSISLLLTSGVMCKIISNDISSKCLSKITEIYNENPNHVGLAQVMGTIANSLFFSGDDNILQTILSLHNKWNKTIANSKSNLRLKISALVGISCLAGSNNAILPATQNPDLLTNPQYQGMLNGVIKILHKISNSREHVGLQGNAFMLLSHMALSFDYVNKAHSHIVPSSYSYLPDTSVLKYVFSILQEMSKKDILKSTGINFPKSLLSVMVDVFNTFTMPPINIGAFLSLFKRENGFDTQIQSLCLKLTLSQSIKLPTAASYLSSWISSPAFYDLPQTCHVILLSNLHNIIKSQSSTKIEVLLKWCVDKLSKTSDQELAVSILKGIKESLSGKNLTQPIVTALQESIKKIYCEMSFNIKDVEITQRWFLLGECLSSHSEANSIVAQWKNINNSTSNYNQLILKSLFVRCYCTTLGLHPLSLCNDVIEGCAKLGEFEVKLDSLWILSCCMSSGQSDKNKEKIEWLQEIMGFIKQSVVKNKNESLSSMVYFLLRVLSVAVAAWVSRSNLLCLPNCLNKELYTAPDVKLIEFLWNQSPATLPQTLSELVRTKLNETVAISVIDWVVFLSHHMQNERPNNGYKNTELNWDLILKLTITSFQSLPVYQRHSVWTEAANALYEL